MRDEDTDPTAERRNPILRNKPTNRVKGWRCMEFVGTGKEQAQ